MKRLMTANMRESSKRYSPDRLDVLLKAQIENAIEVGWKPEDIILLGNFDFEFMKVKSQQIAMNDFCLTGSKMFALKWLMEQSVDDVVWSADLDCWQNVWFECPEFDGHVGASQYSNPKFNGGSIFWKPEAWDIVNEVVNRLIENSERKEEPTLNKVFKSKEFKDRVSVLDHSYNVGCSGFAPRHERSLKPIRVCHFHPNNSVAWEIHALDRDGIGAIAVTVRLERLLRKYFPKLAVELKRRDA